MLNRRRIAIVLFGSGLMSALEGCAAGPNERVRHGLQIELGEGVGRINNIRYTYGDEFVNERKASASSPIPWFIHIAPMILPEEFLISWEAQGGEKHAAKIPVRSRLSSSIENKIIVFVVMQDTVEGYIAVSTPFGQKRERFF
jgi:hypothetical protein